MAGARVNRNEYEPFSDAQGNEEDVLVLPVPAEELQHLTGNQHSSHEQLEAKASKLLIVTRFLWQGGSPGDAWLHMTAAQVKLCPCSLKRRLVTATSEQLESLAVLAIASSLVHPARQHSGRTHAQQ